MSARLLAIVLIATSSVVFVEARAAAEGDCVVLVSGDLDCSASSGGDVPPASSGSPAPPNLCGPWEQYDYIGPDGSPTVARRELPDGTEETLYFRMCPDGIQFAWYRPFTASEVAAFAYRDLQSGRLPAPVAEFSPPPDALLVNLETWFGVDAVAPVSVRAEVPGVWAQATATVSSLELVVHMAGDDVVVTCEPWGSSDGPADGCVWTPLLPSVPKVTGTANTSFEATMSIVWSVSWVSSTGESGTFPAVRTRTVFPITVSEIQTIGG